MKVKDKASVESSSEIWPIPTHVAIIMDGNGRWAEQRQLPRLAGHQAGTENIRRVIEEFAGFGVNHLTLYAFSTENWERPDEEVRGLMTILEDVIHSETQALHERGVRLLHLGALNRLSPGLQDAMSHAIDLTKDNQRITLSVAFNYGGRTEILDAVQRIVQERIPPQEIDEAIFSSYLNTAGTPDPDLIIRTAGELRLSNFLLWQSAYSEYYCTNALWPDFDQEELRMALIAYSQRHRRFGRVKV
jgi:undecaprenyl diphosphate synthase